MSADNGWTGTESRKARAYWLPKLQADQLECLRCGQVVDWRRPWDVDHRLELAAGGSLTDRDNQWPAHRVCNRRHGQLVGTATKRRERQRSFDSGPTTLTVTALLSLPALDPDQLAGFDPAGLECEPLHVTPLVGLPDMAPFTRGCELLGFTPTPAQTLIGAVILSAVEGLIPWSVVAVTMPRRAGKTLAVFAVLVGLCVTREDYLVAWSAQNGIKGVERFSGPDGLVATLAKAARSLPAGVHGEPYEVRYAAGSQRVVFTRTRSVMALRTPVPSAYRGDAADVTWLDEAQEHNPEDTQALMGAILPTMDTRPGAVLVVSGTPGTDRVGLLWEELEAGRSGAGGIVEYGARPEDDPADPATWYRAHPGLAYGLTTLHTVADRYRRLGLAFLREYLCLWPRLDKRTLIDPARWDQLVDPELPVELTDLPREGQTQLAWDCAPDGAHAAVYAAWKDHESDEVSVQLVAEGEGTSWVAEVVADTARVMNAYVAYDAIGPNIDVAAQLTRLRVGRLVQLTFADLKGGYANLLTRIDVGTVWHEGDPLLTQAVTEAERRPAGDSWLWRRTPSAAALVAATHAVWRASNTKPRRADGIR